MIEPLRFILIDTINLREEINGLEATPLEETTHPENPSIMSQQERLSIVSIAQLGGTRTSSGKNVLNVLIDLITIYDKEERSGVSLITQVQFMEEGELGETSAPTPEYLTSIPK